MNILFRYKFYILFWYYCYYISYQLLSQSLLLLYANMWMKTYKLTLVIIISIISIIIIIIIIIITYC